MFCPYISTHSFDSLRNLLKSLGAHIFADCLRYKAEFDGTRFCGRGEYVTKFRVEKRTEDAEDISHAHLELFVGLFRRGLEESLQNTCSRKCPAGLMKQIDGAGYHLEVPCSRVGPLDMFPDFFLF